MIILEVSVECLSTPESTKTSKARKGKTKWGQFNNKTLTVLMLRSDGQLISLMSMS